MIDLKKLSIPLFCVFALAIAFFATRMGSSPTVLPGADSYNESFDLSVHYIDVGQADSCLVCLPGGKTMLIDAGNNSDGDNVVGYLQSQGVKHIDFLIGTHPHSDHIGGLDDVIKFFDIGKFYMPRVVHTTQTFEDVLDAADAKGLTINTAKDGVRIYSDGETAIDITAPCKDTYESLNNYSAVILLKYKDASFVFTGDAETESENEITADIKADVLKVGHHGSSTSSSERFLNRVKPSFAVISCGTDNSYGHPHRETLDKLQRMGVTLYRTDINGTVICRTDGEKYYWECEKQ